MKNRYLKQIVLSISFCALAVLGNPGGLFAQVNFAATAEFIQSGGGTIASGYGPDRYNDGFIGSFPQAYDPTTGTYGYVNTDGWIKAYWFWPIPPLPINKIVFYFDERPLNYCEIWRWNQATNQYDSVGTYSSQTNKPSDSIFLSQAIAITGVGDTILFKNLKGVRNNPTFREIELWHAPACAGNLNNTIEVRGVTPAAYDPQVSTTALHACLGSMLTFNAQSAYEEWGHAYQWQVLPSGYANWIDIPDGNGPGVTVQAMYDAQYRVIDTCVAGGVFAPSSVINITVDAPVYLTPPLMEDFESWVTGCVPAPFTFNVPALAGWTNTHPFHYNSWRSSAETISSTNPTTPAATVAGNTAGWAGSGGTSSNNAPVDRYSGSYSARAHTKGANPFIPINLDLYVDCSITGSEQLYFYYSNVFALTGNIWGSDSLRILMSVDSGMSWTRLAGYDTSALSTSANTVAARWKRASVEIPSSSPKTILRFQALLNADDMTANSGETDIYLDSVYIATNCVGTPVAGYLNMGGVLTRCAGETLALTTIGTTLGGGLVYTWEQSADGTTFTAVTGGSGYNTLFFQTPPMYDTVYYRLKIQCGAAGTPVYTDVVQVNVKPPTYASIPYMQSFETWVTGCSANEIPESANNGIHWANTVSAGSLPPSLSWRRDDQGTVAGAGWLNPAAGAYAPVAGPVVSPTNTHSARFHSTNTFTGKSGTLDLFVDLSSSVGDKQLSFFYTNTSGQDSMEVYYSTDAGNNFSKIWGRSTNNGWNVYTVQIPSNSATSVVRFKAYGDRSTFNTSDIGLDSITIIPPCTGSPLAGTISNPLPCKGVSFTLNLQGYTTGGSITYIWQRASLPSGPWTNTGGSNVFLTTSINNPTYFRAIATCVPTGQSDTTPVRLINLEHFYYCYCGSAANTGSGPAVGRYFVQRVPSGFAALSNGSATPLTNNSAANATYSDFRYTIPPFVMYHDSSYGLIISQTNTAAFTAATVTVWIDTNHNGAFDMDEIFLNKVTSNISNPPQQVGDTIHGLNNQSLVGITGMRVRVEQGANPLPSSCGGFGNGEVEDYLVEIRYPPCDGPLYPGTAYVSATSACVGYAVSLVDTTHEQERSDIAWVWQYSPDSNSWADIAGSQMKDSVPYVITGHTYFRLRMLCLNSFDTTFSNIVSVALNPPFSCYCYSEAIGGEDDISDIGGLKLDKINLFDLGPHLLNTSANRSHTDYTTLDTLDLWVDSTYEIKVYHIMRTGTHQDAKITLFMDLNNDLQYTVTPSNYELIWTGFSTASTFIVVDSIRIPSTAIPNVLTGMRLILNNDTGPNAPSDSACGPYTSGETHDYIVRFRKHPSLDVETPSNISYLSIFPNPSDGRFNLTFMAKKPVEEATITVTNVTGQIMIQKNFRNPGTQLTSELNLSGLAQGVYIVELKADEEREVRRLILK